MTRFSPSMPRAITSRRRGWAKPPIPRRGLRPPPAPCWPMQCCARRHACPAWSGRKPCRARRSPPIRTMPSARSGWRWRWAIRRASPARSRRGSKNAPAQSKTALDTAVADDPKNAFAVSALGGWHIEVVRGGGATMARLFYGARECHRFVAVRPFGGTGARQCRGALPDRPVPGGV